MELDIYTRVSRLSDKRMRSVTGQESDCRERITDTGATVGKVHSDPGKSAWNPKVKRPGWDTLMARLESGETDGVVVFELARFTRRPMEGERLIAAAGNGLAVLDSEQEFDLTSPDGKAAFRDHMKMAAYESDNTSRKTRRGKRLKALRGEVSASHRAFGFELDGITHRESEAQELRDIVRRLLAGETQDALRRDLNERGILTSYGKRWARGSLRQVLLRPRNAGLLVYRGEPVATLPGEPILDRLTFDRVVALYASRRPGRPVSARYLASGIAVCGLCGHSLTGRPRNNMKPYPDGEVKRQYWCSPSTDGCGRITVDQRALDGWAGDFAVKVLSDPASASAIEREANELSKKRSALESEAAGIEATLVEIAGRLGRREISLQRHDAICGPLDSRLGEISAELSGLAIDKPIVDLGLRTIPAADQEYGFWLAKWQDGTTGERRAMLITALRGKRPIVGPGKSARFDSGRVSLA